MSILPGERLGYVGDRLRFLEKSSLRWRIVGRGSRRRVDEEEKSTEEGDPEIQQQNSSRKGASAGARLTGRSTVGRSRRTVDRSGQLWCTNVHNMHRGMPVDRAGRPQEESGRPGGRPTESPQLSVGNGRPARSTGHRVGRPTSGSAVFREGLF